MKAALWYKKNDIRIEETKEPKLNKGQVKIKVKWAGICGSDVHEYTSGPFVIPTKTPHPLTGDIKPVVMGHEFSGEVVEIGEGVTKFKIGDRVVGEPQIVCGKCNSCKSGKYNLCPSIACIGFSGNSGGGFSEYAVVNEDFTYKIPQSVSYEEAALTEPLTVALHSTRRANFKAGQTALVLGAGPIGLATIDCLKASGAKLVIVLQRKSIRQEYAKKAGADYVFDPNEVNIPFEVRKLTEGIGVDVAFETTGAQIGFDTGIDSIRSDGTLVITSLWESPIKFNPNSILFTEKTILGTLGYRHEFPMTLALLKDGRIEGSKYITKKIFLDDIVEEGFKTLIGPHRKKHLKILVTPDKSLI